MTDTWTGRLSEYLDGELTAAERQRLEAHLRECGACAQTLDELRAVTDRARGLEDRPPAQDLWSGIVTHIHADTRRAAPAVGLGEQVPAWRARRFSVSLPQLLAAGIALMLVSAAGVWLGLSVRSPAAAPVTVAPPAPGVSPAVAVDFAIPEYHLAVTELERALAERRSELDPATLEVLERSLATIDQAIAEARSALAEDPSNRYINAHLAYALRRKLELLRRAATIAGATT